MIETIAQARGVLPQNILPGAGSSDLIFRALRQWLGASSHALLLDPTYGEYAHVLERVIGCTVDRLTLSRHDQYAVDLSRLEAALADQYDLVVLVNPNSPTGRHVPRADLERLLRRAPAGTRIWVDETYVEYAGANQSLEQFAACSDPTLPRWCGRCKALAGVEHLDPALGVAEVEHCHRQITYLMQPAMVVRPSLFWRILGPKEQQVSPEKTAEYVRFWESKLREASRWMAMVRERKSPPRCLECGSSSVVPFPTIVSAASVTTATTLPYEHPGCGGQFVRRPPGVRIEAGAGTRVYGCEGNRISRGQQAGLTIAFPKVAALIRFGAITRVTDRSVTPSLPSNRTWNWQRFECPKN